jgi:hypothetical protein
MENCPEVHVNIKENQINFLNIGPLFSDSEKGFASKSKVILV